MCIQDLRWSAEFEWDDSVSDLDIAFDSTAEAVTNDIKVCGGLVKVHCLCYGTSYTSCSICNWNHLEIIYISNIQIIVYNCMYSVRSWLELGNLQRMKNRKKDKGLSVRCMILLEHPLQRNEPEDGTREESSWSGWVHVWLPLSDKCWSNKSMALASGFCIANKICFCFCASTCEEHFYSRKFVRCPITYPTWDIVCSKETC